MVLLLLPAAALACRSAAAQDARSKGPSPSGRPDAPAVKPGESRPSAPALAPPADAIPRAYDDAIALIRSSEIAKRERPSVACGRVSDGSLVNPAALPLEGFGFAVAARRHRERDLRYGTDELIFGLAEVAATLAKDRPGAPRLMVGNIGSRAGGPISYSISHQNGRDVDLLFFVTDLDGRPCEPRDLVVIASAKTLEGREEGSGTRCRLDLAREWELIEALLESRHFGDRVRQLFIWDPLRARLLDHARARCAAVEGKDAQEHARRRRLLERAAGLLRQPANAGPHNDHLHVRIGCSEEDRKAGCEE